MTSTTSTQAIQPLAALAHAAACFDLPVEPSQLAHQLGLTSEKISCCNVSIFRSTGRFWWTGKI